MRKNLPERENEVTLLMVTDDEKWHFLALKGYLDYCMELCQTITMSLLNKLSPFS